MSNQAQPQRTLGGWGSPGFPLAPWWLREFYGDTPVEALSGDDVTVTWKDLGPDWRLFGPIDPAFAKPAVTAGAGSALEKTPALRSRTLVPPDHTIERAEFDRVSWSTRTNNVLRRQRVTSDPSRLNGLTIGSALQWHNFGLVSLLDLSCGLEAISAPKKLALFKSERGNDWQSAIEATSPASIENWMFDISVMDPRVDEPGVPRLELSLGDALSGHPIHRTALGPLVGAFRLTMDHINEMNLLEALEHYIKKVSGLQGKRLKAVWARLGFASSDVATLAEAGDLAGVTRERIRQLMKKIEDKTAIVEPLYLPQLDECVAHLEAIAPTVTKRAQAGLRRKGHSGATVPGVLRAAKFFRRPTSLTLHDGLLLDRRVTPSTVDSVRRTARKLARASGASNIPFLQEDLSEQGVHISEEILAVIIDSTDGLFIEDRWFWDAAGSDSALVKVARMVLAINQPQNVRSIREGLRRRLTYRKIEPTPPRHIVSLVLERHPDFVVESEMASTPERVDPAEVLGELDLALVAILKGAEGGLMTRPEFMEVCYDSGLNMHSVGVYTSYSPCLERVGPGIWAARGEQVDPVQVALAAERLEHPSDPRVQDGGWTAEGNPWFAFELTKSNIAGPVAGVDRSIRTVLRGRSLPLVTQGGLNVGRVGFSDDGASAWGFTRTISVLGAEPEDVIRVEVDLIAKAASVGLIPPDLFD